MSAVERRYFSDRSFFEQVEAAADELVDDYVQGRLSASERRALEDLLALPVWQGRLTLARQLRLRLVESGS